MHSFDTEPKGATSLRQGIVSTATPRREHDRPSQGLAPRRHPLRPMRPHLLLGHLHRSYRHFLAAVVSPEPSLDSNSKTCMPLQTSFRQLQRIDNSVSVALISNWLPAALTTLIDDLQCAAVEWNSNSELRWPTQK